MRSLRCLTLTGLSVAAIVIGGCGTGSGDGTGDGADDGNTGSGTAGSSGDASSSSASTGATDSAETSDTGDTSGTTSETTTTDSGDGDTGGDGDGTVTVCQTDADCRLVQDCCTCDALPLGEPFQECPADCRQPLCDAAGIDTVECRAGACTLAKRNCNPVNVVCAMPPPDCPEGMLPEVDDTDCWSGACIEQQYCDYTDDCSACEADEVCVSIGGWVPYLVCEKIPPACADGPITCECAGWFCEQMGFQCSDGVPPTGIECYCPNC